MRAELHIDLETLPLSWEAFVSENKHRKAVALDGYVADGPMFDSGGLDKLPKVNFNHHENVDRLATRSTCAQVSLALRQGLEKRLDAVLPTSMPVDVYVNDCDEDVCLSWFLLNNAHMCNHASNPILNRLVSLEDMLDCTAGTYPFPATMPALEELAWIFQPYRNGRANGALARRDPEEYRMIIDDVGGRISAYLLGAGGKKALDTRYNAFGGGKTWTMVEEIGADARRGMIDNGINAYVATIPLSGGRWRYTVGRTSQYVNFDVPGILGFLDAAEGGEDHWGGGDLIGGSPRVDGSAMSPEEVHDIIEEFIAFYG